MAFSSASSNLPQSIALHPTHETQFTLTQAAAQQSGNLPPPLTGDVPVLTSGHTAALGSSENRATYFSNMSCCCWTISFFSAITSSSDSSPKDGAWWMYLPKSRWLSCL